MQSIESNVSNFKVDPVLDGKPVKLCSVLWFWSLQHFEHIQRTFKGYTYCAKVT